MRKRKRKAIAKRYALKRKRNKTLRNVKQIINKHWNLLQINSNLRDFSEVKGSYHLKMASGCDNVSETFKLQIFKAISTLRKSRKRPDGKAIQEYMNNSGAGNINESLYLITYVYWWIKIFFLTSQHHSEIHITLLKVIVVTSASFL